MNQKRSNIAHLATIESMYDSSRLGADVVAAEVQQIFASANPSLINALAEKGVLRVEFVFTNIKEDNNRTRAQRNNLIVCLATVGLIALSATAGIIRLLLLQS